jgi:hypothetical protein
LSGFDPGVAAAFLLGSDMRAIATTTTLNQILTVMQSDFFEHLPGAIGDATTLLLCTSDAKQECLGKELHRSSDISSRTRNLIR